MNPGPAGRSARQPRRAAAAVVCAGLLALAGMLLIAGTAGAASILTSKHNLSVNGPGGFRASAESQVCVFCHAAHNTAPTGALWNRRNPGTNYTVYSSSTTRAGIGQPTGASLLCLSCHDGTIALGELLSRAGTIAMSGGTPNLTGNALLGTDLSDDHPVSFAYLSTLASTRGELAEPGTLTGRVKLDGSGQMQCTACHDPHDDANGKFLVMSNLASALCQVCHIKNNWAAASHKNSGATWNGGGNNPWPHTSYNNVAANGCENCHRPHAAGGRKWLLNAAAEEDNCYTCHMGTVAQRNLQPEFTKASIHPIAQTTGVHDAGEAAVVDARHVECVDCHDPHASNAAGSTIAGSLVGARGISIEGGEVRPARSEFEICLRCHGDSGSTAIAPYVTRQIYQTNLRLQFNTANPSHHAVAGPGRNPNVPSLSSPWTTSSVLQCSDCHNNDSGPGAGGSGPKGPHGSNWRPLLERPYMTIDRAAESAGAYAICYKCHNRNAILNEATPFPHRKHIVEYRAPCSICHDPHGISSTQGNSTNNSKLINFDTTVVKPNRTGLLRFESTGTFAGRCFLSCHDADHNQDKSYK